MKNAFSIGGYAEKSIHKQLKNYFENDENKHEIKVCGYIADICDGKVITEIQSKNFNKLIPKIEAYLNAGYDLRIVYPVSINRYLNWINLISMEVVERRKSPCRESIYSIFDELYKIRNWLKDSRITFTIVTLDCEEYRLLDGYGQSHKNKATRIDKLPTNIRDVINFNIEKGYEIFIENSLRKEFTSKQFSKVSHCKIDTARKATLLLRELNKIQLIGKQGREYLYSTVNVINDNK